MRKETKNQGKTKLLPALAFCLFFKQSWLSHFAEKLCNSPFTQLQARLPIAIGIAVPPHIAQGKYLVNSIPFRLDNPIVTNNLFIIYITSLCAEVLQFLIVNLTAMDSHRELNVKCKF
jgi:hypothetical protein